MFLLVNALYVRHLVCLYFCVSNAILLTSFTVYMTNAIQVEWTLVIYFVCKPQQQQNALHHSHNIWEKLHFDCIKNGLHSREPLTEMAHFQSCQSTLSYILLQDRYMQSDCKSPQNGSFGLETQWESKAIITTTSLFQWRLYSRILEIRLSWDLKNVLMLSSNLI